MVNDYEIFNSWLYKDYTDDVPSKIINIFENEKIPKRWIIAATKIVHRLSETPWYTQEQLYKETLLKKEDLISLNSYIRDSDFLQEMMVHRGLGRKYWNTMIPYVKSDRIGKVLDYEYDFPLRLAFFPGISCMYYCGFCGRNQTASYDTNQVLQSGIQRYKDIISDLPKNSTISISGGLEPLTNLRLGEIITYAKSLGHRVPLITNGHMLTPSYLKKQSGIWDLDSLRVSLYGVDEESTYFVTRHPKAYKLVKNNIIEFLLERNRRNSNVKVGLNYVIIPENVNTVLSLIDYIYEINSKVNNGNGIDFLTLRDDYGSVTDDDEKDGLDRKYSLNEFLTENDRKKLIKIFKEFNVKQKNKCPNLHVDYGYAMVSLGDGIFGKPLARVDGKQMRKSGFPQLSVAIDSAGDVFLYREAGFLDRQGNDKFIAGRIPNGGTLEKVLKKFVGDKKIIDLDYDDSKFMDSYDHLITLLVNQAEQDLNFGIPFDIGPVKVRGGNQDNLNITLSNNWYRDEKN